MNKKNQKNANYKQKTADTSNNDAEAQDLSLRELLVKQTTEDLAIIASNLQKAVLLSNEASEKIKEQNSSIFNLHQNLDPLGIAPYTTEVMTKISSKPDKLIESQIELFEGLFGIWQHNANKQLGIKDEYKTQTDKRFKDKEWEENAYFSVLKDTYLFTSNWINNLVNSVDDIDDLTKRKTKFFTEQMINAFSPSNFLMTNPVAIKELLKTKGESVSHGVENLLSDLERNKNRLSVKQTDLGAFEVGKNIAITPGKIVYRGEIFELIQYTPTTEEVYEIPLLFFPPWINKFYILDMRQDNSMIKWMVSKGYTVFVVSWVNPTNEMRDNNFEYYMDKGILEALEQVQNATGTEKINCVGYCIGGTLLATTMAYLAQIGDERINAATFFASQQDFKDAGDLKIFTDDMAFQYIKNEIEQHDGVLDSSIMAETFNYLRSNDLVYSFMVNNYLLGKDPKPFDLLFWNSDQTKMPKALHLDYLDNFYRQNNFSEGRLVLKNKTLSITDIKTPIYVQSSKEDHIAPYKSIYNGAIKFGGEVRMILAGSGHIAGVINHPDANKYMHWLPKNNAKLPDNVETWQESLTEQAGSWWNDWNNWLGGKSGNKIKAKKIGSGKLKPICDAPGTYVLEK